MKENIQYIKVNLNDEYHYGIYIDGSIYFKCLREVNVITEMNAQDACVRSLYKRFGKNIREIRNRTTNIKRLF